MHKATQIILSVAAVALVGIFGYQVLAPRLGGDFAGGILPTTVVSASASGGVAGNGYVYPVGSLSIAAVNGFSIGGSDQYHGLTAYVTASGTPATVITLGPLGATTSTATTSVAIPESAGLAVGAICSGGAATTTVFVSGCVLTSTNGATGTATVAYSNITGSSLSVPTSTRINVTFDELPY